MFQMGFLKTSHTLCRQYCVETLSLIHHLSVIRAHYTCKIYFTYFKSQVIAREDKGAIGVDYNRSPTIFFKTRGGDDIQSVDASDAQEKIDNSQNNTIKDIQSKPNEGQLLREQQIASFCDKIKIWLHLEDQEQDFYQVAEANNTGKNVKRTKTQNETKKVTSLIKPLSNRLYSVEQFLYLIACS